MDLGDFLEVLVKEEREGKGKEEQETVVLNECLEVENEIKLTDGLKLLTADEFAEIKSRLDGRQIHNRKDLDEFREILDEMIYQRVKLGTGGNNFWCRVASCKLRRGQRQKMRDHVEAKHEDRVQHWCTAKHCKTPCKTSASLAQHILNKH